MFNWMRAWNFLFFDFCSEVLKHFNGSHNQNLLIESLTSAHHSFSSLFQFYYLLYAKWYRTFIVTCIYVVVNEVIICPDTFIFPCSVYFFMFVANLNCTLFIKWYNSILLLLFLLSLAELRGCSACVKPWSKPRPVIGSFEFS